MRNATVSILAALLIAVLSVAVYRASRDDPQPKPQIGKAVCVKTTVRPDGSVHTETCIP